MLIIVKHEATYDQQSVTKQHNNSKISAISSLPQ
jgi:hypothetical protein